MIQVYTGDGKGKTTAAWGLALRAVGQGMRVAVLRFMKPNSSGEVIAARALAPGLTVFGESRPYDVCKDQRDSPIVREDNRQNFSTARDLVLSGGYDMVVLDEMNIVLGYGHVSREEMIALLDALPSTVELVLTSRGAPDWLIERADLVTEMREIKHPSSAGTNARKGIEF